MSEEFISYADAQEQLGIGEGELEQLVKSGELRAFRDGDDVTFKAEDIAGLRRSRETEPTIVLSDTQAEDLGADLESPIDLDSISADETVLNIEGLLEDEAEGTTPIPGADLLGGGLLEEDEVQVGAVGDDTVLDTDDLDLDLGDDDALLGDEDATVLGSGIRTVQMVKRESHAVMTALLAVTLLLCLAPTAVLLNLLMGENGTYPFGDDSYLMILNPLVESILGLF